MLDDELAAAYKPLKLSVRTSVVQIRSALFGSLRFASLRPPVTVDCRANGVTPRSLAPYPLASATQR